MTFGARGGVKKVSAAMSATSRPRARSSIRTEKKASNFFDKDKRRTVVSAPGPEDIPAPSAADLKALRICYVKKLSRKNHSVEYDFEGLFDRLNGVDETMSWDEFMHESVAAGGLKHGLDKTKLRIIFDYVSDGDGEIDIDDFKYFLTNGKRRQRPRKDLGKSGKHLFGRVLATTRAGMTVKAKLERVRSARAARELELREQREARTRLRGMRKPSYLASPGMGMGMGMGHLMMREARRMSTNLAQQSVRKMVAKPRLPHATRRSLCPGCGTYKTISGGCSLCSIGRKGRTTDQGALSRASNAAGMGLSRASVRDSLVLAAALSQARDARLAAGEAQYLANHRKQRRAYEQTLGGALLVGGESESGEPRGSRSGGRFGDSRRSKGGRRHAARDGSEEAQENAGGDVSWLRKTAGRTPLRESLRGSLRGRRRRAAGTTRAGGVRKHNITGNKRSRNKRTKHQSNHGTRTHYSHGKHRPWVQTAKGKNRKTQIIASDALKMLRDMPSRVFVDSRPQYNCAGEREMSARVMVVEEEAGNDVKES